MNESDLCCLANLTRNKGKEKSSHEEVAWEVKTAPGRTDQVLGVEGAGCAGRLALTGWLSSCGLSKWRMVLLWAGNGGIFCVGCSVPEASSLGGTSTQPAAATGSGPPDLAAQYMYQVHDPGLSQ